MKQLRRNCGTIEYRRRTMEYLTIWNFSDVETGAEVVWLLPVATKSCNSQARGEGSRGERTYARKKKHYEADAILSRGVIGDQHLIFIDQSVLINPRV